MTQPDESEAQNHQGGLPVSDEGGIPLAAAVITLAGGWFIFHRFRQRR
jgi:hypothetical protein